MEEGADDVVTGVVDLILSVTARRRILVPER